MLDLDKIRARLAAAAVTARDSQCDVFALRELVALHEGNAQDMLSEFDRLTTALAAAQAAREQLRARAEHAEAILSGMLPGPLSDALLDARNHQSRTEGVSAAADWGRTVGRAMVVGAQAAPVVEWRTMWDGRTGEVTTHAAEVGSAALRVAEKQWRARSFPGWKGEKPGWAIVFGMKYVAASGPETGPAGKAAAEAAYRRACGLPAIPACAG